MTENKVVFRYGTRKLNVLWKVQVKSACLHSYHSLYIKQFIRTFCETLQVCQPGFDVHQSHSNNNYKMIKSVIHPAIIQLPLFGSKRNFTHPWETQEIDSVTKAKQTWTEKDSAQVKQKKQSWKQQDVENCQPYQQDKDYFVTLWENNSCGQK